MTIAVTPEADNNPASLQEPLLAATVSPEPEQVQTQTMAVEAPTDLEEGYTFEGTYLGTRFNVAVPQGGVKKGQKIIVQVPLSESSPQQQSSSNAQAVQARETLNDDVLAESIIPTGRWREGLCDCCEHGCCEPTCCLAWWCNGIALGQVMSRMKLNACAHETSHERVVAKTFGIVTTIWLMGVLVDLFVPREVCYYDPAMNGANQTTCYTLFPEFGPYWLTTVLSLISFAIGIYFLVIGTMTRMRLRQAFGIPGNCCQDCCAFFWCGCCTVTQMARHTHDYKVHPGACCTKNGLRKGAPEVV